MESSRILFWSQLGVPPAAGAPPAKAMKNEAAAAAGGGDSRRRGQEAPLTARRALRVSLFRGVALRARLCVVPNLLRAGCVSRVLPFVEIRASEKRSVTPA